MPPPPRGFSRISKAFTLAEVLITLMIIGIIASLTIPSVIQNYKKHEASTRLKKFVGIMETTITKAKFDGKFWPNTSVCSQATMTKVVNTTKEYVKLTMKTNDGIFTGGENLKSDIMVLPDGSYFIYDTQWCTNLVIIYDVNGDKKPNVNGKDRFAFYYCPEESGTWNTSCKKKGAFEPYRFSGSSTRQQAKSNCRTSYENAFYCSSLLWYDGFEFKSDYPIKL